MIKGINGHSYLDLTSFINLKEFDNLQTEIARGFALSRPLAKDGTLIVPHEKFNQQGHPGDWKPLFKAYEEFLELDDSDPIKITGKEILSKQGNNSFVTYLKHILGAYDLYTYYVLWDFKKGWRDNKNLREFTPLAEYFPNVIKWIDSLDIFSHIGRAGFFVVEAGGISFEHRDPAVDPEFPDVLAEFIHIRPNLDRPFYVRDDETFEKTYINTRVGYWNNQDWHGGEQILKASYGLRLTGLFSELFKKKIGL